MTKRTIAPNQVRNELAEDLAAGYDDMVTALRDAMKAKGAWLTCKACGKKALCDAPDHKTRLDAAVKWTELGLGKRQAEPEQPTDLLTRQINALSTNERRDLAHWLHQRYPDLTSRLTALSQTQAAPSRATPVRPREAGGSS